MERNVNRLALINRALWELLQEKTGLEPDLLGLKVTEIDLRDSRADGRALSPPASCSQCQRNLPSHTIRCLYCGHLNLEADVFRGL